jgi:hypothetical protein
VQADRAEVPLDDDQVPAVRDPVEVEELELLMKPSREFVLPLSFGKSVGCPDPPSRVRDELAFGVVDRDRDPPRHGALLAVP